MNNKQTIQEMYEYFDAEVYTRLSYGYTPDKFLNEFFLSDVKAGAKIFRDFTIKSFQYNHHITYKPTGDAFELRAPMIKVLNFLYWFYTNNKAKRVCGA